jgi:hypothetical protein
MIHLRGFSLNKSASLERKFQLAFEMAGNGKNNL